MTYVWLVIAVDWGEAEVLAVLSTEVAAVARARVHAVREARSSGRNVVIEKHAVDPAIDAKREVSSVEYLTPALAPAHLSIGSRIGSAGYGP